MSAKPIVCGKTDVMLHPVPLDPNWIKSGNPIVRQAVLSNSNDRTACTLVWDCTPGAFEWHYSTEETIHILEGSVILDDGTGPARRFGPGDVVFFPAGAVVHWTVESQIRKLAFFRRPLPLPLALVFRGVGRARTLLRRRRDREGFSIELQRSVASVLPSTD